ncbi:hypothetical protein B0A52_06556 [Exophiala mesophila]|uniref:MmgE/PrpD family protein n=1 Tax=Exophiala mesophila TaxID=212818 RepID=A0A438N1C9_EXOME|nr:hypothetical protein B0A52_06556 [Exophiala mesophila]
MTDKTPIVQKSHTARLCEWIESVRLQDVPGEIQTRAKYLILDGLACALVGAHLPWSETAAKAVVDMEPEGPVTIIGWGKKISPISAALLNSTFIQGFELDDWHSEAPLHSNSIILPTLFAAVQHVSERDSAVSMSGNDFLLSTIVGYEVGPRVGIGLHGGHILTKGWHSGAVFGPSAAAASACKLLQLPADNIEDALGIACTQACGLMSAQYESEVKRMQHGFAARNGLFATLLARHGYVGIKKVYDRPYGGFLAQFSAGNGKSPQYLVEEIDKDLGTEWKTNGIRVKPHAAMAGTHPTIDCIEGLQRRFPVELENLQAIQHIRIEMGEAMYHHGGWAVETRPLTATGAQMSNAYVGATQLVDRQVLAAQFRHDALDRDMIWDLVGKTTCESNDEFKWMHQRVTITLDDGTELQHEVEAARGFQPPISNDEIVAKWRDLMKDVIDHDLMEEIEQIVLNIETCKDVGLLIELLGRRTRNPLD